MINVEAKIDGYRYSLSLQGHAEYDEYGKDIVCSAASMITHCLYEMVSTMDGTKGIELEQLFISDGLDDLVYIDKEFTLGYCFEMVVNGLISLAQRYPDNVKVTTK